MFPLGNAARATRWVSLGIGAISCGWSDLAILLGSKDGDQTPSLQTLLASGLCEITLRCLMMPHEIGIGPRLMSCKGYCASSTRHAPSALLEGRAQRIELRLEPGDPRTQDQPPAGQVLQRRQFL